MLSDKYPFQLPPLPYPYESLEPYIDTETMHLHHDKHFKTYIDNLNKALEPYLNLQCLTLEQLLTRPYMLPCHAYTDISRNAGGVYNHSLYFQKIAPSGRNIPTGKLQMDINQAFGSFESFMEVFSKNAKSVFGSGWTYLVRTSGGMLKIVNTKNQDTPLALGYSPIIICDVWEHAYYLKYKNVRADYIHNFWNVVVFDEHC